ncbi:hypothetical protein Goshw_003158, partial [Gossypium schwendimanii]|nr:hypothetical protein [Gossypium schwendimanii]
MTVAELMIEQDGKKLEKSKSSKPKFNPKGNDERNKDKSSKTVNSKPPTMKWKSNKPGEKKKNKEPMNEGLKLTSMILNSTKAKRGQKHKVLMFSDINIIDADGETKILSTIQLAKSVSNDENIYLVKTILDVLKVQQSFTGMKHVSLPMGLALMK